MVFQWRCDVPRFGRLNKENLESYALRLEEREYIDRKGEKKKRKTLPLMWKAQINPPLSRIFLKAGSRVYGCGKDGLVAAVDLPREGHSAAISWQAGVDDDVWNMLAGDDRLFVVTKTGRIYCFGGNRVDSKVYADTRGELPAVSGSWTQIAHRILKRTGIRDGYCLALGLGSGGLVEALLRDSKLHIVTVDPDGSKINAFRRKMNNMGLYGRRVAAHTGDPLSFEFPPYMAGLIVSEDLTAAGFAKGTAFVKSVFHPLRPYGGVACFLLSSGQQETFTALVEQAGLQNAEAQVYNDGLSTLTRVGALPGSADWTHQYCNAANTVVSKDSAVKAPLGLLWFGGPSNEKVLPRHGHGPSPQVSGGRVFIEGPDMLRATDAYTGRLLWETELKGVGKYYDNTSHQPGANALGSNYVSLPDGVYVVYGSKCLRLDPATGKTVSEFEFPATERSGRSPRWGYVAVWKDVLIGGVEPVLFEWDATFLPGEFTKIGKDEKARKDAIASLASQIRRWKNFQFAERGGTDDDLVFVVDNLNKLLNERKLFSKIPSDVRAKADAKRIGSIQEEIDFHLAQGGNLKKADWRLRELNRQLLTEYYPDHLPRKRRPSPGRFKSWDRTASKTIVAMDRHSGKILWTFDADHGFRHNAIAVGGGKVFCIDKLPDAVIKRMKRRGVQSEGRWRIVALGARTGDMLWKMDKDVFGSWLGYSEEHDILLQAGRRSRDMLRDEPGDRMMALRGSDGSVIWDKKTAYSGPCLLYGDVIITQGSAFSLLTGERKMRKHPLTGESVPWTFKRNYGCNTAIGSTHLLTFRSAAAGYYDLAGDSGTGNFGGFKSGCTSNLIVANGLLSAPDYTRTCTCSYQNQTSLALVNMPDVEMWTFTAVKAGKKRIRRLGINFGAPGDRLAENGTLWLEYPTVGGPSPHVPVDVGPEQVRLFRHHASRIEAGRLKWVTASGIEGVGRITIRLAEADEGRSGVIRRVASSADDAEERDTATILGSGDLELVEDGLNQLIGMRFNNLTIDPGAKIDNAYVQFKVDEKASEPTILSIRGEATDDAAPFEAVPGNISQRKRTTASVNWAPAPWTTIGEMGEHQRTPDLSPIIREIISRPGWKRGNSVVLIISGTGKRVAKSFDGDRKGAPVLHVGIKDPHEEDRSGKESGRPYTVRLYFSETERVGPRERVFNVAIQGKTVLEKFDIVAEAGGPNREVLKTFKGIWVEDDLTMTFTPSGSAKTKEAAICGAEIVAEGW